MDPKDQEQQRPRQRVRADLGTLKSSLMSELGQVLTCPGLRLRICKVRNLPILWVPQVWIKQGFIKLPSIEETVSIVKELQSRREESDAEHFREQSKTDAVGTRRNTRCGQRLCFGTGGAAAHLGAGLGRELIERSERSRSGAELGGARSPSPESFWPRLWPLVRKSWY